MLRIRSAEVVAIMLRCGAFTPRSQRGRYADPSIDIAPAAAGAMLRIRSAESSPSCYGAALTLKLASGFERQADILLRERRLSGVGAAQIVELVDPHPFLERCLRREAVEQHREPPGHARRGPHAT